MRHLVVIPAFNEEAALPGTVARLGGLPEEYEILIVNDGSRDSTKRVAEELAARSNRPLHVVSLPVNCGIGVAVQTGYRFAAAAGDRFKYVIQFDADGQHDAEFIGLLVAQCEFQHLDLCVGSRFLKNFGPGSRSTFSRRIGIRFFARLIGLMSNVRVTDPTSGFRCLGPRAWERFAEAYPEDYPEPESLFWCARNRLNVGEAPVRMFERQGGVSSIRQLRTLYYMVKVSLAIIFDRLRRRESPAGAAP
ncbi:glycosyltransferase family 2 protein [Zavarzinella formosa]|uniref:glycosyltransferase family 2 protein n=1 Tax=Zavarzinella formosa TaxID=360055 RepID=UPI0002D8E1D6|nr:glycosyltransferase family 2 protein [Zavarzinella formosa]